MRTAVVLGISLMTLSACVETQTSSGAPATIEELPESVMAIVAPQQDLNAVVIDPIDGCYVFRHIGPVETTLLPLRAVNGRPICTR